MGEWTERANDRVDSVDAQKYDFRIYFSNTIFIRTKTSLKLM